MALKVTDLATELANASTAKGGRSKAKEITVAQASQAVSWLLTRLAKAPSCDVGALFTKYAKR